MTEALPKTTKYERVDSFEKPDKKTVLRMKIPDNMTWKAVINAFRFAGEGNILVSEHGLEIRSMTPNKVAMIDLLIPAQDFIIFECNKPMKLGISFGEFYNIIRKAKTDDAILLELAIDGGTAKMKSVFENEQSTKTFGVSIFELPFIHPVKFDNIPVSATMIVPSAFLKELMIDTNEIKDSLDFHLTKESIIITCEDSYDSQDYNQTIPADSDLLAKYDFKEEVIVRYSWDGLSDLITPLGDELVKLTMATDNPLILETKVFERGLCRRAMACRLKG